MMDEARAQGHEVMLEVPMQPIDYPDNDPGPLTLMANARLDELSSRLTLLMGKASGYFALTNYQGGAFFKDKMGVNGFLNMLKARGLGFIDDGSAKDIAGAFARGSSDHIIDGQINAEAINAQLTGLEILAKSKGSAMGSGFAYPVSISSVLKWSQGLNKKGLQLAPASAIIRR